MGLLNSSLDGNTGHAVDFDEADEIADKINERALKTFAGAAGTW
jgi:hypothetical protein